MPGAAAKEKHQGNLCYTSGLLFTSINIHDGVWCASNSATSQEQKSSFFSSPAVENWGISKPVSTKESENYFSLRATVKIKCINLYKFLGKCQSYNNNSINTNLIFTSITCKGIFSSVLSPGLVPMAFVLASLFLWLHLPA